MPVVRISDGTWQRLQRHARPFEDTPEDVVKLALDALEGEIHLPKAPQKLPTAEHKSRATATKLPQRAFREPLIAVLKGLGGGACRADVQKALLPKIKDQLTDADYAPVTTGEPRWWNAAQWERSEMVKAGLLKKDSRHGYWELTHKGMKEHE